MPSGGRPLPPEPDRVGGLRLVFGGGDGPVLAPLTVGAASGAEALSARCAAVSAGFRGGAAAFPAEPSESDLRAAGRGVEELGGEVYLFQGLGLPPGAMRVVAEETRYVLGLDRDPGPMTALGVFTAIKALAPRIRGRRMAVMGAGRVGSRVAALLAEAGAEVLVADTDEERARSVAAEVVPADEVLTVPCDVLSPNARDVRLGPEDVERLAAKGIAGSDDVIGGEEIARALESRRILFVPELIAGSGWLLALAAEREGADPEERVLGIEDAVRRFFREGL